MNLGTHAALGPAYILYLVRRIVRPGDTVLLTMGYQLLDWGGTTKNAWADPLMLDYLLARDPAYFRRLGWREQVEIALRVPFNRLKKGIMGRFHPLGRRTPGIVYDARLLDERGDQTGHKESMRKVNSPPILKPITPLVRGLSSQPSGMEDVRQFCRWAATNGVRVVAVPPPLATNPAYAQPAATQVQAQVKAFYEGMEFHFGSADRLAVSPE